MSAIEEELSNHREAMAKVDGQKEYLEEAIAKLKRSIMRKARIVTTIQEEERRWGALLQKLKTGNVSKKHPTSQDTKTNNIPGKSSENTKSGDDRE
jgi:hypothetical protein